MSGYQNEELTDAIAREMAVQTFGERARTLAHYSSPDIESTYVAHARAAMKAIRDLGYRIEPIPSSPAALSEVNDADLAKLPSVTNQVASATVPLLAVSAGLKARGQDFAAQTILGAIQQLDSAVEYLRSLGAALKSKESQDEHHG